LDAYPTTVTQLVYLEGSVAGPVWGTSNNNTFKISFNRSKQSRPWYVCTTASNIRTKANIDANFIPLATPVPQVAPEQFMPAAIVLGLDAGPTTASPAGYLMLDYEFELIDPIVSSAQA